MNAVEILRLSYESLRERNKHFEINLPKEVLSEIGDVSDEPHGRRGNTYQAFLGYSSLSIFESVHKCWGVGLGLKRGRYQNGVHGDLIALELEYNIYTLSEALKNENSDLYHLENGIGFGTYFQHSLISVEHGNFGFYSKNNQSKNLRGLLCLKVPDFAIKQNFPRNKDSVRILTESIEKVLLI